MALDPRISLAVQPVQIQPPNLLQTMLTTATLREQQQQEQLRNIQLASLLRSQQQEQALEQYLRERNMPTATQAQQPVSPLNPQVAAGPITQTPFGRQPPLSQVNPDIAASRIDPAVASSPITPALLGNPASIPQSTAAPPGPVGLPGQQLPTRSGLGIDPREALARGGLRALPLIEAQRKMEHEDIASGTLKINQSNALIEQRKAGMDLLLKASGLIHDQPSLDAIRKEMAGANEAGQALAALLPQTYDQVDPWRKKLREASMKMSPQQTGLTLQYGQDAAGNIVPLQTTNTGAMVRPELPEGVQLLSPPQIMQTPQAGYVLDRTGRPIQTFPKNYEEPERQKEVGKAAGERPEAARKMEQQLQSVGRQHELALKNLDDAVKYIDANPSLSTGIIGTSTKGIPGTPGYKLSGYLENIVSRLALDTLQDIRQNSPTGGALGNVSDKDVGLLRDAIVKLRQGDEPVRLKEVLGQVRQYITDGMAQRQKAFDTDFAPALQQQRQQQGGGSIAVKTITRAQIKALAQRRGMSEADVEQQARTSGYQIAQ